jgi:hypothetical protein
MSSLRSVNWVVIGAGPGGISAVGNILSYQNLDFANLLWIDPNFTSGKLKDVPEIPR